MSPAAAPAHRFPPLLGWEPVPVRPDTPPTVRLTGAPDNVVTALARAFPDDSHFLAARFPREHADGLLPDQFAPLLDRAAAATGRHGGFLLDSLWLLPVPASFVHVDAWATSTKPYRAALIGARRTDDYWPAFARLIRVGHGTPRLGYHLMEDAANP